MDYMLVSGNLGDLGECGTRNMALVSVKLGYTLRKYTAVLGGSDREGNYFN